MSGGESRLAAAVRVLEGCREFAALVPEVRVNFVFLPEGSERLDEVLGVDGRITVVAGMPKAAGAILPGVSDHMARLIVELRKHDPAIRTGLNFRWDEHVHRQVEQYCRENGLEFGCIDRTAEPSELIGRNKGSIPWKVQHLVTACAGRIPAVFYESRGWGKEPLFFAVGSQPVGLAKRLVDIARTVKRNPLS